jgi:hypothetical protein
VAGRVRDIIASRTFDYRIDGKLYGVARNQRMTLRSSNGGRLDARDYVPNRPIDMGPLSTQPTTQPAR